ncbi:hypothetical protein PENTCL1PPCAC_30352 [Pristionchus entomophagus]|uniref:Activator of Hsp90 ATPase AHSA1-like N-terminal domain-containing protein n=1 Tax=Pristionchus entomophagus TaxID=358040 RepID=A0AAV5SI32_9BILA|nr:hypothetical protein PENTCL1PPCAC_1471 [Pristionchus entomophagus]GMT08178.1 hypothetical protein PENTCL1PPCAC_30352 [Pristionchus entomophagus]
MAKWGEGDPRWIVEERPDATNVNNWHWSEKNATPWSKDRLKELLEGLKFEDGSASVELTTIKKMEGEATANNRKAKLIFLFEWELEVNFVGRVAGSEDEVKGHVEIPNLSDENDADEVDVNTTISSKSPMEAPIRHLINKKGVEAVRAALAVYIRELKEEFSKGLILPTDKPKAQVISKGKTTVVDKKQFMNNVVTDSAAATAKKQQQTESTTSSGDVPTKSVSCVENFKVPPARLFECLTQREMVNAWTNGSAAQWDLKPDGDFALFGGMVTGKFLTIDEPRSLEFTWRLKSFPAGHFAHVVFTIKDKGDSTDITIDAANVPEHLAEETQNGFSRYYLQALARTFGFSSRVF